MTLEASVAAFREGFAAFNILKPGENSVNPYHPKDQLAQDWLDGWRSARRQWEIEKFLTESED